MKQYASTHLDPGEVPVVEGINRAGRVMVAVKGTSVLVAHADHLRTFCASIIAQLDALEGGEAA